MLLKLIFGNPYVFGGIALAFILMGVGLYAEHAGRVAAEKGEKAALERVDTITADRDAQAKAVKVGQEILIGMKAQWDEADAKAQATIKAQTQQAGTLAAELQVTTDQREAYLQQLKETGHARPIVVSQTVHDGWDPVVVAGMRRLKCMQLQALNAGTVPSADCGVQTPGAAGQPAIAGDPPGAGDYRPTFDQQLQFLADAWRLRDWGASCYADKRAIAASQAVTP